MADFDIARDPYELIAADIRAKIMSGDLAPGDVLESTAVLCARYHAANQTVQKALSALKNEGWILGQRGVNRSVRRTPMRVVTAGTFLDLDAEDEESEILAVREQVPTGDVADALDEERAVVRHRLVTHADGPLELDWSYYPASIAAGTVLADERKIVGGGRRVLAGLGWPERRFTDVVMPRAATQYEARGLLLPPGVPVLRVLRVIYSTDDRVTNVAVLVKAGHRVAQRYVQDVVG